MPTISERDIAGVLEGGNNASSVIPVSGEGFVKLTYLWGKLRLDKCDEAGKIVSPEKRGGGSDIPPQTTP